MKMEKNIRGGWSLVIACLLVLGLLVEQCSASAATSCNKNCFMSCILSPTTKNPAECAGKCARACPLKPKPTSSDSRKYFCKLGCFISMCTNLTPSKLLNSKEKVRCCVDSCSKSCSKK